MAQVSSVFSESDEKISALVSAKEDESDSNICDLRRVISISGIAKVLSGAGLEQDLPEALEQLVKRCCELKKRLQFLIRHTACVAVAFSWMLCVFFAIACFYFDFLIKV